LSWSQKWQGKIPNASISGRRVVILRIFEKKTQKTSQAEAHLALNRMKGLQDE
jgi:phage-related protein